MEDNTYYFDTRNWATITYSSNFWYGTTTPRERFESAIAKHYCI
jgi:hypothetical protein